jgi:hypothetical protein
MERHPFGTKMRMKEILSEFSLQYGIKLEMLKTESLIQNIIDTRLQFLQVESLEFESSEPIKKSKETKEKEEKLREVICQWKKLKTKYEHKNDEFYVFKVDLLEMIKMEIKEEKMAVSIEFDDTQENHCQMRIFSVIKTSPKKFFDISEKDFSKEQYLKKYFMKVAVKIFGNHESPQYWVCINE